MTSFPYRFSPLLSVHGSADFDFLPATLPTVRTAMDSVYVVGWGFNSVLNYFECLQVGTNLTDLTLKKKKVTVRELGGCMSPIWPSYFKDCSSVIVRPCLHCTALSKVLLFVVNTYKSIFIHSL